MHGIEHIALCAENVPALIKWYQRIFHLDLVKEGDAGPFFLRFPDGLLIEFVEATGFVPPLPAGREKGFRHVAIMVSFLEKMAVELKNEGVEIVEDYKIVPGGTKLFLFRDIEGNIVQLIERKNPIGT